MAAAVSLLAPAKAQSASDEPERKVIAVAAAADAKFAFDELIAAFEKAHPLVEVRVSYGSSGNFYAQLSQRAPFDIFFSADASYPAKLVQAGFAVPDSEFTYAIGKIVLWAPTNSAVDPKAEKLDALKHASVKKIAIANPEHAPYGKAAVAAMQKRGVYEGVKEKLVYGENVAQAAQFVQSGAADIGIIALSLATAPAMKVKGTYWEIPTDAYPRLEQAGVILAWVRNLPETKEFKQFVLSEPGRQILQRYGFSMPGG
jgi:molybdate transport system substrate-binding protein